MLKGALSYHCTGMHTHMPYLILQVFQKRSDGMWFANRVYCSLRGCKCCKQKLSIFSTAEQKWSSPTIWGVDCGVMYGSIECRMMLRCAITLMCQYAIICIWHWWQVFQSASKSYVPYMALPEQKRWDVLVVHPHCLVLWRMEWFWDVLSHQSYVYVYTSIYGTDGKYFNRRGKVKCRIWHCRSDSPTILPYVASVSIVEQKLSAIYGTAEQKLSDEMRQRFTDHLPALCVVTIYERSLLMLFIVARSVIHCTHLHIFIHMYMITH